MLIKRKDWNDVGVSEVIGTILILGMTVTLFSAVLIWVYTIPTPTPNIKVDFVGQLEPIYRTGVWDGVNITVRHNSGEALQFSTTKLYLTIQVGTNRHVDQFSNVGKITIPPYYASPADNNKPYGLIDGSDNIWNAGERWFYTNHKITQTDTVEVMIVDTGKSVLLWRATLQGLAGLNPPVFVDKWADKDPTTSIREPPATGVQFYVYANVIDPDGDLNKQSVYATFAAFFGIPDFRNQPWKMRDNGTGGDQVANDGIFTLTGSWLKPVNMSWDGSVVIFNATDMQGHKTTARMTLTVVQGPGGGGSTKPPPKTGGAPPNLHYNGQQGFNIFNATEWDNNPWSANETRTFKEREEVVVVVASALLKNSRGAYNTFYLYDPFSNLPPAPVVYGLSKVPTSDTQASNTLAFQFYEYVNGYNVFTYRFELNNASSVGTNYYTNPTHPPYYWFARYPLEITIWDDIYPMPNKFHTTDTINITDNNGNMRTYPKLDTFKDPGFAQKSNTFNFTDVVYVQITMKTVDTSYYLGLVIIQDFLGGAQVSKSPLSGKLVNQPICPVTAACTAGNVAVEKHDGTITYRFALNLSLANDDPWIPGSQNYALRVASVRDFDEEYTLALQSQLVIWSPEFKLDIASTNWDLESRAWGTHDLAYWFENYNSWNLWSNPAVRIFSGNPPPGAWERGQAIRYLDFDQDGDLDLVASFKQGNNAMWIYLFRRDLDTNGDTIWTPVKIWGTGGDLITAITSGNIDKDTYPEIILGNTAGRVWYYKNDGSWTEVTVDTTRTGTVNSIDIGDFNGDHYMDIAVARAANKITWYPNLDGNGRFTTVLQADGWTATQENTVIGSINQGDYTWTTTDDSNREDLKEESRTFPAGWSNDTATQEATFNPGSIFSGSYTDTKTDNGAYEVVQEAICQGNKQCLEATWQVAGVPQGDSHKLKVNGYRSNNDATEYLKFSYSTDGSAYTDLTPNFTNTTDSGYVTWTLNIGSYSGTVWIRATHTYTSGGEAADKFYIDHMYIETHYPGKTTSALEHYWKLQTLPNRPSSTYTMYVKGYRDNNPNENDFFHLYYSTTGQFGTYSGPVLNISATSDTQIQQSLPNTLGGASIWVKIVDSDRTNGRTGINHVFVNLLNITVVTQPGVTGIDINNLDGANSMAIDAGDQNSDGFDDLALGTSAGNIYKILGSAGGLQAPAQIFASPGGSISGIKLGEFYANKPGLEIAASSGAVVYIYQANLQTGTLIKTLTTPGSETITAFAAGDVDGDGDDDVVVGTTAHIVYFKNNRDNSGNWMIPNVEQWNIGVQIYGIDLGDVSNSAHRGR